MKFSTFIFFILIFNSIYSQDGSLGAGFHNLDGARSAYTSGTWIFSNDNTTTNGSVYMYEDWVTFGVITTTKNQKLSIKGLNYDTQKDVFVAKISKDSLYMFNNYNLKEVKINNRKFKWYTNVENGNDCYLEVLAFNKDIEILKMNRKKVKSGQLNPLTQVTTPDKYVNDNKIYFKRGNKIEEIKLKKKAFCKLFNAHSKAISSFISKNKLSVSNEKSLQQILNYYNTL